MRELYFKINAELKRGLVPDPRAERDNLFLETCRGFHPTEYGLVAQRPIDDLDIDGLDDTIVWPFPQHHRSKAYSSGYHPTFIFWRNAAKIWVSVGGEFQLLDFEFFDSEDPSVATSISHGGRWQFVDKGEVWFANNGACILYQHDIYESSGGTGVIVVGQLQVSSIVEHDERLFFGGVNSFGGDHFLSSSFRGYYQHWLHFVNEVTNTRFKTFDDRWLIYGPKQGGDIANPYMLEMAVLGMHNKGVELEDVVRDAIEKKELGFVYVDNIGRILDQHSCNGKLYVFGTLGTAVVEMVDGVYKADRLEIPGIGGRCFLAGDENEVIFIDSQGYLRHLSPSGPRRLGFKDQFQPMLETEVAGTFDSQDRTFYLANNDKAYAWNSNGLGEVKEKPISLYNLEDLVEGMFKASGDSSFELVFRPFDLGIRAKKFIDCVEIASDGISNVFVGFYWRDSPGDSWKLGQEVPLTLEGVAYPYVTAVELKLRIRGVMNLNGRIQAITIKYKVVDKRHIRGAYGLEKQPVTARED